jgi:hypothetical protein
MELILIFLLISFLSGFLLGDKPLRVRRLVVLASSVLIGAAYYYRLSLW